MEFRKQAVFPRETLVVSCKGLWFPSPLVNTFSLNLPHSSRQGSTILTALWMGNSGEVDRELELEYFPPLPTLAGLLGNACLKRKPSGFVGLPGEGGAGRTPCTESNAGPGERERGLSWPGERELTPHGVSVHLFGKLE